jgi:hypothetical protein
MELQAEIGQILWSFIILTLPMDYKFITHIINLKLCGSLLSIRLLCVALLSGGEGRCRQAEG